jgi:Na+-transporting methylmalonyl-CoA/oxaloacetate decarboxylase gamma subunit
VGGFVVLGVSFFLSFVILFLLLLVCVCSSSVSLLSSLRPLSNDEDSLMIARRRSEY